MGSLRPDKSQAPPAEVGRHGSDDGQAASALPLGQTGESKAELGWEAFQREYPQLVREHCGKWVAYHGADRIGVALTRAELYQECLRRGLREDEYVICSIQPVVAEEAIGL